MVNYKLAVIGGGSPLLKKNGVTVYRKEGIISGRNHIDLRTVSGKAIHF